MYFRCSVESDEWVLFGKRTLQRDDPSWTLMGKKVEQQKEEKEEEEEDNLCLFLKQPFLVLF